MLDQAESRTAVTWRPSGHPVLWFLVACTALGLAASVVWWAGLVAPRLATGPGFSRKVDVLAGRAAVFVRLRNDGPLPVRVTRLSLSGVPDETVDVHILLPDPDPDVFGEPDAGGFAPFTLEGGQAAEVQLAFPQDECPPGHLIVRDRSAIGIPRSQELGLEESGRDRRC